MSGVGTGEPILRVENLKKHFSTGSGVFDTVELDLSGGFPLKRTIEHVRAVDDVSFEIERGETLGLVGESGCGKSTLGRTILRLLKPTEGNIYFKGRNIADLDKGELRRTRKDQQMIFQDPQSSLNPRMKVGPIVEEPMQAHGLYDDRREERTRELLEAVGLDPQHYNRYPHQFSGGQRQRINLARALSVDPDFIVCDEPTSALDASIQAQVLNTMRELQDEFNLTYLFISHDLSVIRHISDRVAVMYLGRIVELAEKEELFEDPKHPYTRSLLSAIPVPDPSQAGSRTILQGDVPDPVDPPSGCRFRTRCPELIPPEAYALEGDAWAAVREFMRAVRRQAFDPTDRRAIEAEFFDGVTVGGDAGVIVDDAIEDVLAGEWETATELLTESFAEQSVCARREPAYELESSRGGTRYAACHLHRE
ncbi:ABC transporter ATP-binding protein [Halorubrum sp. SD683]|uniref:ABC transporter ATP-binding protein n=1 Tax=Halorubrum sp. SD683 TaxID=1855873 RepID=UPI000A2E9D30|nr:ABC transporter ATP-binding protein [Halorubrum sp. SD683]OTF01952.1 peptide ABC transporter ATP-binding protein [Halorubrum sp. SD683]